MIKVEIKGLDATIKNIDKLANDVKQDANAALEKFGFAVERQAKRTLSQPRGPHSTPTSNIAGGSGLAGSISHVTEGLTTTIVVAKNYAAFVEFGTKRFAAQYVSQLPPDWRAYAATFRGGGGTFDQLRANIAQWCKDRKLKPNEGQTFDGMVYVIARKIAIYGVRAQPYIYPAVRDNTKALIDDLKKIFNAGR
jgi:HK97 gp10 family phage protein